MAKHTTAESSISNTTTRAALATLLAATLFASATGCGAASPDGGVPGGASGDPSAPATSSGGTPDANPAGAPEKPAAPPAASGKRGFPEAGPWVSFYGTVTAGDVPKLASKFRIMNLEVDPDSHNVTKEQLVTLRAGGKNRVISYLNFGSCETYRSYYAAAPAGFASCMSSGALTTVYSAEYPDETWANLSNVAYRKLMVEYVAQRLWDQGIDGFFLDNLEVIEHGADAAQGPCDAACAQGGLDMVWELRQRFPDALIVMQNATSEVTQQGTTHGVPYRTVLDGISHEEVYSDGAGPEARAEMLAWKAMSLTVNGHPFWLAAEDYVGACSAGSQPEAAAIEASAKADGLSSYVTDASAAQTAPCFW
jgi:cysteinyl-tRNA synthetase